LGWVSGSEPPGNNGMHLTSTNYIRNQMGKTYTHTHFFHIN
jgi:hypothetical protein